MTGTMEELCKKEVIDVETARRLGYVGDVEADLESGCLTAICVYPAGGMFRPPQPVRICWRDIVKIGAETVLVRNVPPSSEPPKKSGRFAGLLGR